MGTGLAALVAPGALSAQDQAKDEAFDPAKLIGTWSYVSGEKNGETLDEEHFKGQTVIVTKESITLKSADATFVLKYEIDATKAPVEINLTITESPFGAGPMARGIIELKGDSLKICYPPMEGPTPTKFESKAGSGHHAFVLKRSRPE